MIPDDVSIVCIHDDDRPAVASRRESCDVCGRKVWASEETTEQVKIDHPFARLRYLCLRCGRREVGLNSPNLAALLDLAERWHS